MSPVGLPIDDTAVGMWVGVGSRDEASGHHGSTHFLEHLLFKGTERRSPLDIAEAFDAVGGEANAVTGKEHTCYYARVMAEDAAMAVDVIADMVTSSTIDADDFDSEREVILEELAMAEDDPTDVVHERFAEAVLGEHPLGRPIGGTPETIRAVGRDDVVSHYREHYEAPTLVVTAAGGIEHDDVVRRVVAELQRAGWDDGPRPPRHGRAGLGRDGGGAGPAPATGRGVVVRRDTEQAQVVLGTTGLTATDDRRYVLSVLTTVLGGGMSSRLFQEVREKRGLAYSVYSFASSYTDGGYLGLYAGCNPAKVDTVVDLLAGEWERLATDGLAPGELERVVGQIAGGMTLGLEDSGSRMSRLGKAELVHGAFTDLDEAVARLRAVRAEQVQELAQELLERPRSLAVVGPFDEAREFGTTGAAA
jgi:predicted Zn-dependent peptidase